MRRRNEQLQTLIEPAVTALGYELVGVESLSPGRGGLVRVYIDSQDGISLDDCELVSRQVSGLLDVEDPIPGRYTLEVSSPGVERPLFTPEQYLRFIGEKVRIELDIPVQGRRKITGILHGYGDGNVIVVENGKEMALPLQAVGRCHLVPEDILHKR